ncbi:helicase-related protein [Geodermatophilus africanus]|nr:helicase-related protein [Geodermatophilus africanus]
MTGQSDERRRAAADTEAHIFVTTYAQVRSRGQYLTRPWFALVLDEATALKGGGATWRTVHALAAGVPRVHAFTATPYTNDPIETFLIVSCLHLPGLPDRQAFEDRYVRFRTYGTTRKADGWSEAVGKFSEFMGQHYFRREDALADLDLPQCFVEYTFVPLSPLRQRAMKSTEHIQDPIARHQAQEKIARGDVHYSAGAKEAARRIWGWLRDDSTVKVLVIGEALYELAALEQYLGDMGISTVKITGSSEQGGRGESIAAFRDGHDTRVLIGSTVLEQGLNLQFCRILVSLGLPDNHAALEQRQGRIVRQGSPFPTVCHD